MPRTKKVHSSGRFGVRYGRKVRKFISKVEQVSRAKYVCSECSRKSVKRVSAGIWECGKCGDVFAGGAYSPKTEATKVTKESLSKR